MPKRRKNYLVRFYECATPYRVKAAHLSQATIIARKLAEKKGWNVASVGIAPFMYQIG